MSLWDKIKRWRERHRRHDPDCLVKAMEREANRG